MIGEAIGFALRNLPAILFVLALALAVARVGWAASTAERFLAWLLLLPIGVKGLWAAISHVFFPAVAAGHIGWQVSPFQFEVGMADLAIGVTACVSFWRGFGFKAAAVCAASIFLLGDAIGHIRDMVSSGNFAPGNAGVPFYMDLVCPVLAIALLIAASRRRNNVTNRPGVIFVAENGGGPGVSLKKGVKPAPENDEEERFREALHANKSSP